MNTILLNVSRVAVLAVWVGAALALAMLFVVVLERLAYAYLRMRQRRTEQRYAPIVRGALGGDAALRRQLVASPRRHRLASAALLIMPLIEDRDPARIAATRAIVREMSLVPVADRFLRSRLWWRRAIALRALGLLQERDHTAAIVGALDDPNADVRAAALDALADLRDPASLQAIVVRMHDDSLHRGRRGAALAAFGSENEPFLLELATVDPAHRANYAKALAICGTGQSRPALCAWTGDARVDVRATAFEALAHVGLDDRSAAIAIAGLESGDEPVRAMAAFALRGWTGAGDTASHLARHLDDAWPVAVRAAQSLESLGPAGVAELQARAARPDLAGVLARQMLWEHARC